VTEGQLSQRFGVSRSPGHDASGVSPGLFDGAETLMFFSAAVSMESHSGQYSSFVLEHPELRAINRWREPLKGTLSWGFPEAIQRRMDLLEEALTYQPDGIVFDLLKGGRLQLPSRGLPRVQRRRLREANHGGLQGKDRQRSHGDLQYERGMVALPGGLRHRVHAQGARLRKRALRHHPGWPVCQPRRPNARITPPMSNPRSVDPQIVHRGGVNRAREVFKEEK